LNFDLYRSSASSGTVTLLCPGRLSGALVSREKVGVFSFFFGVCCLSPFGCSFFNVCPFFFGVVFPSTLPSDIGPSPVSLQEGCFGMSFLSVDPHSVPKLLNRMYPPPRANDFFLTNLAFWPRERPIFGSAPKWRETFLCGPPVHPLHPYGLSALRILHEHLFIL